MSRVNLTLTPEEGKPFIIHVNRQHIAMNARDGRRRPVFTVKPAGPNSTPIYCLKATVDGTTTFVDSEEQLKCGARAWCEAELGSVVFLEGVMDFQTARNQ